MNKSEEEFDQETLATFHPNVFKYKNPVKHQPDEYFNN